MTHLRSISRLTALLGVCTVALLVTNQASAQIYPQTQQNQRYGTQAAPQMVNPNIRANYTAPQNGRYGAAQQTQQRTFTPNSQPPQQNFWEKLTGQDKHLFANRADQWRGARLQQYQTRPAQPHPMDQFQRWDNTEPQYTLYQGDQIDIVVSSAPELSRTLTVGPDGRIVMPMSDPIMAAGRTMTDVQNDLTAQLAKQLVDPRVEITPRAYGPQQIFVGGEVAAQGTYTLPGPIGTMEAILMAGGFQTSARTRQVVVLRRAKNGGFMARTIDYKDGLHNIRSFADNVQMKRGDIIFVPRSDISEVGLFMQNIRGALPFDISLSYNIGDSFTNNN